MKNGHCPMCNSTEVYINESAMFHAYAGQDLVIEAEGDKNSDDLEIYFIPHICTNCGFTAMYVVDMDAIQDLPKRNGWEKVSN